MTFPRTPRAVIFDMDGLLFDTEALHRRASQAAAEEQGGTMPIALFRTLVGIPQPEGTDRLRAHFGDTIDVDALGAAWSRNFTALAKTELQLKPGVEALLDRLDALQLPRAIATSTRRATVDRHLAAAGIEDRFDTIVALGDYAHGKPAPDPYFVAADRLGIDPRHCLALEDSHNGVRSAAAAGMMTVMVPDLLDATDEMRGLCVAVAGDLHAVSALLDAAFRD